MVCHGSCRRRRRADGMDRPSNDDARSETTPRGAVSRLQALCADATRELSAAGVGVSMTSTNGGYGIVAASDAATERIEELQFTFGEGPCVDAFSTQRPV